MSDTPITNNLPIQQTFFQQWLNAWNDFWFRPSAPETLAVMRILTGLMVFYSHVVWTLEFGGFIGGRLLPIAYRSNLFRDSTEASFAWSHFDWLPESLWMPMHIVGLLVVICFIVGWKTRVVAWLTAALVISYANRATGALFGLDQILAFLTLYLAVSRCGEAYSIDRWRESRREDCLTASKHSSFNTIATRLIQIHLCVVYLFAGLGKCQGDTWWNGEAIWGALASYEYQTIDMTFMADQMPLVAIVTLLTLAWEISYASFNLAEANATNHAGVGDSHALGNRNLYGHDDIWIGHVDSKHRFYFADLVPTTV